MSEEGVAVDPVEALEDLAVAFVAGRGLTKDTDGDAWDEAVEEWQDLAATAWEGALKRLGVMVDEE